MWCYFPLWWGLALAVDGLCLRTRGTSLLTRNPKLFVGLALFSIPAWWIFEVLNNLFARDWYFSGGHLFTDFPMGLLGTSALSALIPTMFGSAEWIAGWDVIKRIKRGPIVRPTLGSGVVVFGAGLVLLCFVIVLPHYAYAFVWLATLSAH